MLVPDSTILVNIILGFNTAAFSYFISINIIYFGLLLISYFSVLRYRRRTRYEQWRRMIQSPLTVAVSIIAPAYNEELTIAESVKSLLMLEYPLFEVIVVNDGSKDNTLTKLKAAFNLYPVPTDIEEKLACKQILGVYRSPDNPRLVVLDKANGGKADALNAGINVSRYPLICAIDSDSLIEGSALLHIVKPFMERPGKMVAVGGIVRVANGCTVEAGRVVHVGLPRTWLPLIQIVEYLRAFLFGRSGLSALHGLLVISGAFGVFQKDAVIAVGGYRLNTVGEDMELVVHMHRYMREQKRKYEIRFLPDPVCWTEVPESLKSLGRQRNRWQRGLIDSLQMHRKMMLNPRYGAVGMVAFPYFVFFEMLAPMVELSGYIIIPLSYALGIVDFLFFALFLTVAILLGAIISMMAIILEELSFRRYTKTSDLLRLVAATFLENFGYRQLTLWWRLKGSWDYFRGRTEWGRMERKGFVKTLG
jgi:cellulose synthase/poly-beta-1,6-N-acetylglucosamine synthase-like glycosyltransferase